MAEPIVLKLAPRDPREALYHRLEKRPSNTLRLCLLRMKCCKGSTTGVCSRRCGARSDRATK